MQQKKEKSRLDITRICFMRKTGLEPVRCKPHAPQTCASASSATLALSVSRRLLYYTLSALICQYFFESFLRFFYFCYFDRKEQKNTALYVDLFQITEPLIVFYSSNNLIALIALPSSGDLHSLSGMTSPMAKNPCFP